MHGLTNLKICVAKQAKLIFQYKKIKIKLYKTNAAIWFNKTCRIKQLTPNYIKIRIKELCIKLELIKELYYDARPNKSQELHLVGCNL